MSTLREDSAKILKALIEGDKTRNDILELTGIKPTRLHDRLNFLLKRGDIEVYDNQKDRRISLYRISKRRVRRVKTYLKWHALDGFLSRLEQRGWDPEEFLTNYFLGFDEDVLVFFPKKAVEMQRADDAMEELVQHARKEGISVPEYMRKLVQEGFGKRGSPDAE